MIVLNVAADGSESVHDSTAVSVIHRAGCLAKNTLQRGTANVETVKPNVHLPKLQVGKDSTIPVQLPVALVVDSSCVEAYHGGGCFDPEDRTCSSPILSLNFARDMYA